MGTNLRRFKFRAQSVLNLREKHLEDERLKLASIISTLESQKLILKDMIEKKDQSQKSFDISVNESNLDIQLINNFKNYIEQLVGDIRTQEEIIKRTEIQLSAQQQEVNEAYKQVKILEKLKEKQYQDYLYEFNQAQIKELDDITTSRYKKAI